MFSVLPPSRRAFVLGAASGLALTALAGPAFARRSAAAAAAAASGVAVDVSRLRALGLGAVADLVGQAVATELRGRLPSSGHAVVRITGLSLNAYAGSEGSGGGDAGGSGGAGANFDYLEGDLLHFGPGGELLSQRHLVTSLPASSGGPYYLPGSEQRRIIALARNFAAWIERDPG